MLEELSTAQKVVGVKQSLRALREGRARKVFLACDADPAVTVRVEDACASVPVERDFTMRQRGRHRRRRRGRNAPERINMVFSGYFTDIL